MSALGHKRTFAVQNAMSALPPKADMCGALAHVRFVPIADMCKCGLRCAAYAHMVALKPPSTMICCAVM